MGNTSLGYQRYLLLLLLFFGGTQVLPAQTNPLWNRLDEKMNALNADPTMSPESKIVQFQQLIFQADSGKHIPTQIRSRYFLARTLYESGRYHEATTLLDEAWVFAEHNYPKWLGSLSLAKGSNRAALGDEEGALEAYFNAIKIGEETKAEGLMATGYMNVASVYFENDHLDFAFEFSERALEIYEQLGSHSNKAAVLNNIATAYKNNGQYDEALTYFARADSILVHLDAYHDRSLILLNIGDLYVKTGAYEAAHQTLGEAIHLAQTYQYPLALGLNQVTLGELYFLQKEYRLCLENVFSALEISQKIQNPLLERESSLFMFKVLSALGKPAEAEAHFGRYQSLMDSIHADERQMEMSELRVQYESEEQKREIDFLRTQEQARTRLIYLIVAGGLLLLCFTLLLMSRLTLTRRLLRFEQDRLRLEQDYIKEEQARKAAEQRLKQQKLEWDLAHRNRELTTSALNLMHKNESLLTIKERLKELQKKASGNIKEHIREITQLIQSDFQLDRDWDNLKVHFEQVHPDFFDRLRNAHPQLTQTELRHCAYIRLNLSNKDVARLINISTRSVQMARYRIKKKLEMLPEDSLIDYVSQF